MNQDPKFCWVALNLVKGIGAARMRLLLDCFGSPEQAWQASSRELQEAGLSQRVSEMLVQTRQNGQAERVWETIQRQQMTVITWADPDYPRRLIEIDQPPPVLYLRGRIEEADSFAVAIVGTRRATPYGRQVTGELSEALVRNGISVVSGLARGIDGVAHEAALKHGGRTLAVLGSGVDEIYPPEHRRLAEQIAANAGAHGAVISDYPPGTQPEAANFPPRNRIISGLSQAIVVVEAGEKSGALITAAFAAEQGRQVFAVPGSIYAQQSRGANRLIQEGAHLLLGIQDILDVLDLKKAGQQQAARAALPGDPTEAGLLRVLSHDPLHIDEIGRRCGLPIEQVSAALTFMELKGMVRQVGGMNYVLAS
jgi:DNA processing protein